jgi:hypothetical protein
MSRYGISWDVCWNWLLGTDHSAMSSVSCSATGAIPGRYCQHPDVTLAHGAEIPAANAQAFLATPLVSEALTAARAQLPFTEAFRSGQRAGR